MRRMVLAIALLGLALPASASECLTVEILHEPHISEGEVSGLPDDGTIRHAIEGHYIQFLWGHKDDSGFHSDTNEIVSFDVTNVATATACLDGTVSLTPLIVEEQSTITTTPRETVELSVSESGIEVEATAFDMAEFLARLAKLGLAIV